MKLDENERSTQIRLMKVKDMIAEKAIEERKKRDTLRTFRAFSLTCWRLSIQAIVTVRSTGDQELFHVISEGSDEREQFILGSSLLKRSITLE